MGKPGLIARWRRGLSGFWTNMDAPMPLPRKFYLLGRNLSLRVVRRSTCCGHPGQPGC